MTSGTPAITKFSSMTNVSKVQSFSNSTGDFSVVSVQADKR
jgi:hypothetical protein